MLTPNRMAALICAFFVATGVLYSAHTPLFEGPDELAHFVYTNRIVTNRALNTIPSGRSEMLRQRNFEAHQHPLYYLTAAPLLALFERDDFENYIRLNPFASIGTVTGSNEHIQIHPLTHEGDTVYAVWALRLLSMGMGVITLLCVYHTGRLVWDARLGLGAMVVVASIPMFVHVSSSINNDNLNITLSALAVTILVQMWHDRRITRGQAVALGITLAGILMAKLTGIIAYGYAVGALLLGGIIRRFKWQQVGFALAMIGAAFAIFALWWFVRSDILYNDPIGLSPTLDLWSRNRDRLPSSHEVWGIWVSFWMMLGHLNIPGPAWLMPYVTAITALAAVGLVVRALRDSEARWYIAFMLVVVALAWAVVIYITRQVNVSQGRALFITLAAFAPLMVMGWRALLGARLFVLPIVPVTLLMLIAPFSALDVGYTRLETLPPDAPLASARRIDAQAEGITVHGYHLLTETVQPGGEIVLDVYFSGGHDENPVLFITAQHPLTGERLGTLNEYPGMTATDTLRDDDIYRARMRFRMNDVDAIDVSAPFQVQLALGWRTVDPNDPGSGRYLVWTNADGNPLGGVFINGPVFIDPAYTPPQMTHTLDVTFGDKIALVGATIERDGDTVRVDLLWQRVNPMDTGYTLTVGLLDESGELVAQADAPPPAYPTWVWVAGQPFVTAHELQVPDGADDVRLRVGWYHPESFERLPAVGDAAIADDMLVVPVP